MTEEELKAKIAELEGKDELTEEETQLLSDLKEQLAAMTPKEPTDGGSLNIGG